MKAFGELGKVAGQEGAGLQQGSKGAWRAAPPLLLSPVPIRARVRAAFEADVCFLPAGPKVGSLDGGGRQP